MVPDTYMYKNHIFNLRETNTAFKGTLSQVTNKHRI